MFHVFARSWQGLNLSPGERAFMKLSGGILFTGVGAGALISIQLLATGNHNFGYIGLAAGGAAAKTLWDTVKKYQAAQTDVPLPAPSLAGPPVEMPPVPLPSQLPSLLMPTPQAGGTYVPPPNDTTTIVQPPPDTGTYVPPQFMPLNRDWSGMVSAMPTQRIPTP